MPYDEYGWGFIPRLEEPSTGVEELPSLAEFRRQASTTGRMAARPPVVMPMTPPVARPDDPNILARMRFAAQPGQAAPDERVAARTFLGQRDLADREASQRAYAEANPPPPSIPERVAEINRAGRVEAAKATGTAALERTQANIQSRKELQLTAETFATERDTAKAQAAMERLKTTLGANSENLGLKLDAAKEEAVASRDFEGALHYAEAKNRLYEIQYGAIAKGQAKEGEIPQKPGPPSGKVEAAQTPKEERVSDDQYNMAAKYQKSPQYTQMTPAEQFRIDETVKAWQKQQRGM